MKHFIYLLIAFSLPAVMQAQPPFKVNYQTVIRNNDNEMVAHATAGIQISILQGSADGEVVFSETHSATTNYNGLVQLEIGSGDKSWWKPGFSDVDWSNGPYFIKTETDPTGGSDYSLTGIS